VKSYYKGQINKVLKNDPKPYGNRYRLKVKGYGVETNWMNITSGELKKIKGILNRR